MFLCHSMESAWADRASRMRMTSLKQAQMILLLRVMGFNCISEKKRHLSFFQLITSCGIEPQIMGASESSVCDSSNSCVAALLHLLGSNKEASAHITAQRYQFPSNRTHSFASVCEVCKLHKLRAYIGALTDYSHPHLLLATKDRQPTTFAIWL